ncbi:MAG: hypothetical protein RI973_2276, partial [Bacteroidota bacterium]
PFYQTEKPDESASDNLFRLQLLAGLHDDMHATLRQLNFRQTNDSTTAGVAGFQFQLYSHALAAGAAEDDFESVYSALFVKRYNALDDDQRVLAMYYFNQDVGELRTRLRDITSTYQNKDSLDAAEALRLCRSYLSYACYSRTQAIAKKLLEKIESEKYFVQDSLLLALPDGGSVQLTMARNKKDTMPLPVVLQYSIYPGTEVADCKAAANKGYVGVVAHTRGKGLSKDEVAPFEHDAKDAYHVIDWISKQPWCDGNIGMYGGSYVGFSQWSALKHPHPALKTIVPQVSVGIGIDYPLQNGVFMSYMLRWLHFVCGNKSLDVPGFADNAKWDSLYGQWYREGSTFRSLDSLDGKAQPLFQKWLRHPDYDAFWKGMTPQDEEFAHINIPVLTITGYWDADQLGALHYYKEHLRWNENANHYLLMGPYDHFGAQSYPQAVLGNYAIDSAALQPITDLVFQWFDHTLKNGPKPGLLKDKVTFEILGRNEWRSVATLDGMADDTLLFYLGNTLENGRYVLADSPPAKTYSVDQKVDFADRSEIIFIPDMPPIIDSVLRYDKEKLIFASAALDQPLAISGALSASLAASINKHDMDIVLDLFEQTPDGNYVTLSQNIQRASYAADRSERRLLRPGKVETVNLTNTFAVCKQLQKGSRLVVVLGVNKSPDWQLNYGTGKDVSDESITDAREPLHIEWHANSRISIPVLRN